MKKLSLIFTLILFSQFAQSQQNQDSYEVLWQKAQKFDGKSLTKSALKVVKSISEKAKKENNSAQIVKALLYTSKYAMTLEEDVQLKIINDFKSEIDKSEFPTKNVLESYLANLYWQFFQQNRYQFYDCTKTEAIVDSTNFRTWDLTTLFKEISIHFDASLKNSSGLQKVNASPFKEIFSEQPGSKIYRPTLFDLLAHNALLFYKTSENTITRPADKFEVDNPEILCEAYQYTQFNLDSQDETSLQARALCIYQQLLQFLFPEPKLDALVTIDIERLKYIHQNAVFEHKDERYLDVLKKSAENLKQHEVSALYTYEIALLYHQLGDSYQPKTNTEHHWKKKEALEFCEFVAAQFPNSRAADKCKALKSEILAKTLHLTTEQYIPINTAARLLVDYKNYNGLQLTAHKISQCDLKKLNNLYPQPNQLVFIQKLAITKKWNADLKSKKDYQLHSTEILLPSLPNGQYVILATPKDSTKTFSFCSVQVTNMALVQTRTPTHKYFQLIDRISGQPISGANFVLTYSINHNNKLVSSKTYVTDKMGRVGIRLSNEYWNNVQIQVTHKNDKAYFGEYYLK